MKIDKSKEKKPGIIYGTDDAGDDITGSNFNDTIYAGNGNDKVAGGNGDDTVYGGNDNDTLWGDSFNNSNANDNGQDKLYGEAGDDVLHGGNGKDYLDGGVGNDSMWGDNGSDVLYGSAGADHLYGGNAGDYFVYKTTTDSTANGTGGWSSTTGDWIHDFNGKDGDKLDFTGFSPLTGAGGPKLNWSDTAGAHKVWTDGDFVYADTDGDTTADLVIKVKGVTGNDIVGINHAPTDGDETNSVTEDVTTEANGNLLTNASDPDGDDLDVTVTGAVADNSHVGFDVKVAGTYGTLYVNSETGAYHYELDHDLANGLAKDETQDENFTYEVSDGFGGTNSSNLKITVTGTNDAPTDGDETDDVTEDVTTTADGNLLTNASDPDLSDDLSVTLTGAAADNSEVGFDVSVAGTYGTLYVNSDTGAYHYVLDHDLANGLAKDETQDDSFTYEVSDGNGGTNSSTLTITVTGTNDAPTDGDETGDVKEDTAGQTEANGNLLTNANDPDGDDLDVTVTGAVADVTQVGFDVRVDGTYGSLYVNSETGAYHYVLDHDKADSLSKDETKDENFTYEVSDGNGGTNSSTLTITVTGTNDAPIADDEVNGTNEDTTLTVPALSGVLIGDTDVDGLDTLVVTKFTIEDDATEYAAGDVATILGVGTLQINEDGSYEFIPAANYAGDVPVATYTVDDGNGGTDTGTLTLTVNPLNDGAGTVTIDGTAKEGETLTALFADDDPDGAAQGGTVHYQWQANGSNIGSDQDTYVLTAGDVGKTITVEVTYTDGQGFPEHIESAATGAVEASGPPAAPPVNTGGEDPNDNDTLLAVNPNVSGTGGDDPNLNGGTGNDTIDGLGGDDKIAGNNGNDKLFGGSGDDQLKGNNGTDTIYGQAGNDTLDGGNQVDALYGGSGDDIINGDADADSIFGGSGNDTIHGNDGNDLIMGGFGADTLYGDGGADQFIFRSTDDTGDTIMDFSHAEGDKIVFNGSQSGDMGGLTMANVQIDFFGADAYVSVDTDLDNTFDFQIKVSNNSTLNSSDFLFNA